MKIISKFHDYYDSAQAYGHDDRLVYHRETSEWTITPRSWRHRSDLMQALLDMPTYRNLVPGVLLVCGRAWPMWRAQNSYRAPGQDFSGTVPNTHFLEWWEQKVDEVAELPKDHSERLRYGHLLPESDSRYRRATLSETLRKGLDQWEGRFLGEDFLISENAPACLITVAQEYYWGYPREDTKLTVVANPALKDLGFPRYVDAFAAYQMIETFLGNQLAPVDTAPQRVGDDRIIAQQKGFDEMSFRNAAPGTKKLNRKANRARKRGETPD